MPASFKKVLYFSK